MDIEKARGAFYGCAIGDALGAPLEFCPRDCGPVITGMLPVEQWGFEAGSWTDDTSMMLCLAASLVATEGAPDGNSELSHYCEWYTKGYLSVNGTCFDIGRTCRNALEHFMETGETVAPTDTERCCGNGSLMRTVAVGIFACGNPDIAWEYGKACSATTHAHPLCMEACGVFSALVARAIAGDTKAQLLETLASYAPHVLDARLLRVLDGGFLTRSRDEIKSSGFVLDTLEAALWAFFTTGSFSEGALLAVNLGDDADTVGAVYGSLAGAFYGFSALPNEWVAELKGRRYLDGVWTDVSRVALGFEGESTISYT
jgi:ADP-ribosyl-[dinitrogen reductase] hydrolase